MSWQSSDIHRLAAELGLAESAAEPFHVAPDELERGLASLEVASRSLTLVVPDATRELPAGLMEAVCRRLAGHIVRVVVATGLHRVPTAAEWRDCAHLREAREPGWPVSSNTDGLAAIRLGLLDRFPIGVHPWVAQAEAVVLVGTVELHQYAGFSGGIKAVAIGCADADTIGWFHRPALLRDPGVRVGSPYGNPFRGQLEATAPLLPPLFEVQCALGADGAWRVWSGPSPGPWQAGAAEASRSAFYPAERRAAAVVGVLGAAKGQNLYQASRGVTQLVLQAAPPLEPEAPIALVTEAPEGLGQGLGERAFAAALGRGREGLLEELARAGNADRANGGAQRAFILAMTSARHPVGYVSLAESPELTRFGWRYLGTRAELDAFLGTAERLAVPDPLHRLPRQAP